MATCTPVISPGKFHGQKSLADYDPSPWGHKELDTAEYAHTHVQPPSSWARKPPLYLIPGITNKLFFFLSEGIECVWELLRINPEAAFPATQRVRSYSVELGKEGQGLAL